MNKTRICKCVACGIVFESDRDVNEAEAEARDLFPDKDIKNPDEMGLVCEPCFIKIMDHAGRTDFVKYLDKGSLN